MSAILAAVVTLLQIIAKGLGLAGDAQQQDAGKAAQAAADLEAANAIEDKAVAAGDAYDRLSAADRERLRRTRGDYRD